MAHPRLFTMRHRCDAWHVSSLLLLLLFVTILVAAGLTTSFGRECRPLERFFDGYWGFPSAEPGSPGWTRELEEEEEAPSAKL